MTVILEFVHTVDFVRKLWWWDIAILVEVWLTVKFVSSPTSTINNVTGFGLEIICNE
jgi:hypothetical protein